MIKGLHIEPTNICTLKCPACSRTQFIEQWPQHWQNHSLDIDQLLTFLDIDLNNIHIVLCGNYGDPIYHPNFIEFVDKLKQRGARLTIVTNGSYRKPEWWTELVGHLNCLDSIEFSVDGTPDNFTQYRVNADWKSIESAMRICADGKCHTVWKFIPFEFNQHSIDNAQTLSNQLGIDEFKVKLSDRFDEKTEYLKPDTALLRDRYQPMIEWKRTGQVSGIDPLCADDSRHYISADGYYSPCCYVADHRFYYKTTFGKDKSNYTIGSTTLSQLLDKSHVVEFYQTLNQQTVCQYNCPKS
jgi:MoaA/NifB/PqqE/SkfB family radical SAM enzyme